MGLHTLMGFFVLLILSLSICPGQEDWSNSPEKSHFPRVFMVIGEVTSGATTLIILYEDGTDTAEHPGYVIVLLLRPMEGNTYPESSLLSRKRWRPLLWGHIGH